MDAFRVEATDYLVKPLEIERLRETMARVRERRDRARGLPLTYTKRLSPKQCTSAVDSA